ncbi:MAG: AAA family ATPase, partial [Epsilonproteobacteria bacterium]|nr:AAA family ATPase [Campylobacterota bacterium]
MKKLPIGIQTFKDIRYENYIYIDKTQEAYDLITSYKYVFLSRPRRFGKSLFLDTLRNIFEGNKELFNGLYIYNNWEFEEYPVIKIDWAGNFKNLEETKKSAISILERNQKILNIDCKMDDTPAICFQRLILEAYEKYNKKVVILIDEYDKPILDNIENPEIAKENRDFLRGFYGILKANDEFLKFVFLTGITKFSKASIFSGLNMLEDISLNPDFGNICGYTHKNLEIDFKEFFENSNVDMELVKRWYNG